MSYASRWSLLLFFAVALGWAAPVRAQALNLPLSANFGSPVGVFTTALQATGGTPPYTYTYTPGFMPIPGVRVQTGGPLPTNFSGAATGGLLGVTTAPGTFPTSIRVTDSLGAIFDRATTLTVSPLNILTSTIPRAAVGSPFSFTLTSIGGAVYSWSALLMPPGLSVSPSGVISGTPTTAGTFNPGFTVTDTSVPRAVSRGIAMNVDPFPIVTNGVLPQGVANNDYFQVLSAPGCGSGCTWSSNLNVAGLFLDPSGILSGSPNGTASAFFNVTVTGSNGTATKTFSLQVLNANTSALSVNTAAFNDVTVGNGFNAAVFAGGGTPPYTWSLESGGLPPGMNLLSPGESLCLQCGPGHTYLSGRPMTMGAYAFTLKVTDAAGVVATRAYTWNVSPLSILYNNLPLIGSTLLVGTPYTQAMLAIGGTATGGTGGYTWSLPTLPVPAPGLTLSGPGVVSGTPSLGGFFQTPMRAADGAASMTITVNLSVSGPPTVNTNPAFDVTNSSATLNGTVNPAGFPTTARFDYGLTTSYGSSTPTQNMGFSFNTLNISGGDISGLTCTAGTVYHFRAVASNVFGQSFGVDRTFTCAPDIFTNSPTSVTATTATLQGEVKPNGLATTARFEYGLTASYGSMTPVQSMGSGTDFLSIGGGEITGLMCGTLYHFRAIATNVNGTSVSGNSTFTTAGSAGSCSPNAATGVAKLIGLTSATLTGAARPNGFATTANFEWGLTTAYGNATPQQSMGSGLDLLSVGGGELTGLTCNTTYHVRVLANSAIGSGAGGDVSFKTAPCVSTPFKGFTYALDQRNIFTNYVYGFGVDPAGALVQIPGFPVATNGIGSSDYPKDAVAYDAVNGRLYVINDASGTLSAYSVNRSTGALTEMPFSPIALGAGEWIGVRVHPSGSPVVVTNASFSEGNGTLASFVVTASTATPASGSPFAAGVPVPIEGVFSRDGNYLYTGDGSGLNSMAGFSVAPGTGILTALPGSPFDAGGEGTVGLATDSAGRLFSMNFFGNVVRAFTTAGGVPSAVAGNPFPAGGIGGGVVGVVHPSGFYMVSDFTGPRIGVYQIAGSGASTTMTGVAGSPFAAGGTTPDSLALSKDGGFLVVANAISRNLSMFSVNPATGALTSVFVQPANSVGISGLLTGVAFASTGSSFGDFNSDSKGDLLLRNRGTGQNIGWLMNGLTVSLAAFMPTIADTNWKIAGRGDFDGDGKADVILRNSATGQNIGWLMNGLTVSLAAFMPTIADTNWEIRGVGDFDGDGKADVILRNKSTGQNIGWLMNGLTVSLAAFMPTIADTNWEIVGTGDFNGDGKADVILRNRSTGQNIGWLMNGLTVSLAAFMPTIADTNWEIRGVGDFDGDGKADVVLRNKSTGQNIGWLMNGLTVSLAGFLPTIADTNWEIKGAGDFGGDGKADIILRNRSTGQNIGWLMNGLTVSLSAFMPTIADTNWEFVGQGQ